MNPPNDDGCLSCRNTTSLASGTGRLLINVSGQGNLTIPLDQNIITIGRRTNNDICMRSRFISRLHARIINTAAGAIIEDLHSRNGVVVNSRRIRRQRLRSGDFIDMGRQQLRYFDLSESSTADGCA